jgi:Zn ribbon nucleic-acid-binding protein
MASYQQNWKEYKRLRNTFIVLLLGGVPVFALVGMLSVKLFHSATPASVVAILWFALFFFNGIRLQLWRCPRCEDWFSGTWWYNKSFLARRCVHCGLPKYATASGQNLDVERLPNECGRA